MFISKLYLKLLIASIVLGAVVLLSVKSYDNKTATDIAGLVASATVEADANPFAGCDDACWCSTCDAWGATVQGCDYSSFWSTCSKKKKKSGSGQSQIASSDSD